ncbi:MAG: transposase, partial [Candidatus Micrarchaeaceae archaeon]
MPRGYNSLETSVHFIGYHFVWCTKYRRKVLESQVAKRLRELIKQKAKEKLQKEWTEVANQSNDFAQKLSHTLVNSGYTSFVVEALNVQN